MPVTILSPYSGQPVAVREQDLGRALRDERGRVFYVVEDGEHGRYASMTRKGSAKDLERYRDLQAGTAAPIETDSPVTSAPASAPHDATGVKRRNPVGVVVVVCLLLIAAAAAYVFIAQPGLLGLEPADQDAIEPAPTDPDPQQGLQPVSNESRQAGASYVPASMQRAIEATGLGLEIDPHPPEPGEQAEARAVGTPSVSVSPAVLPETPQDFADQLRQAADDEAAHQAALKDPEPVIVASQTWKAEPGPVVLSEANPQRPYADFHHTASGLRYLLTHRTDGSPARAGNYLRVRYTAQSLDGEPLIDDAEQSFVLMAGEAIRAFDEGLAGIREGEQLKLLVPRGHSEYGSLPGIDRIPDAPFLLDIQLVDVRPGVSHVVEVKGDIDRAPAAPGDTVVVHYVVRVEGRDEVIDATARNGEPMRITLGQTEVIPGLELGLAGVRPGESRLLTIPPYLAYGDKGVAGGLIPPNAVLTFRVTVVDIERPQPDRASAGSAADRP